MVPFSQRFSSRFSWRFSRRFPPRLRRADSPAAAPADDCADTTVLMVHDLAAGYNGTRGCEHITFTIQAGERVGVVGPNGAGKSTLFKALVGLLPHQGTISVGGASCYDSHIMIGYVPQHEAVDLRFPATVWDVVMMGRARHIGYVRLPRQRDRVAVRQALERVGLQDLSRRHLSALSGGQRRRVFVARALAQEAAVLLLDEPFSGVDASAEAEIFDVLDLLRDEGIAVLLATHNLVQAATHYDKLLMLNRGQQVAFGPPAEVYTPETLAQTFGDRIALFREGDQFVLVADDPCHEHAHDPRGHDHHHRHDHHHDYRPEPAHDHPARA